MILTDTRGTILDVNIAFCKMSGFTLEDLEGTIKIITQPGQGTAVEVLLPLTEEQRVIQTEKEGAEALLFREVT